MKTPEEIKAAVLKECGRRVDADDTTIIVGERPVWLYACNHLIDENGKLKLILVSTGKDSWEKGYTINSLGMNLHLWSGATNQDWDFAYRILNLEARELEEKYNDLLKLSNQIQEKADALQQRAQGLVDALEKIAAVKSGKSPIKALGYVELSFKMSELAETALNRWKGGGNERGE